MTDDTKHKIKYDNTGATYHDVNDCPACNASKQPCICDEINARHCPVHNDDTAEQAPKPSEGAKRMSTYDVSVWLMYLYTPCLVLLPILFYWSEQ